VLEEVRDAAVPGRFVAAAGAVPERRRDDLGAGDFDEEDVEAVGEAVAVAGAGEGGGGRGRGCRRS
jgi:hypothetical protein